MKRTYFYSQIKDENHNDLTINRIDWIDFLRGLGMILVVIGHTTKIPDSLLSYLYSFHMPLFFALSGYLFNSLKNSERTFISYIINRFNRLNYSVFYFWLLMFINRYS